MSTFYKIFVIQTKELSSRYDYNWFASWIGVLGNWSFFGLIIFSIISVVNSSSQEDSNGFMFGLLVLIGLTIFLYVRGIRKETILIKTEQQLAKDLIEYTEINNIVVINKLQKEIIDSINNTKRLSQWAIGGFLTIFIFISSSFVNIFSSVIEKVSFSKLDFNNFLYAINFSSLFIFIFFFTLLVCAIFSFIYGIFQTITFFKRRYLNILNDMEYIILNNKHKEDVSEAKNL